jgi:hypothetical protein
MNLHKQIIEIKNEVWAAMYRQVFDDHPEKVTEEIWRNVWEAVWLSVHERTNRKIMRKLKTYESF